MKQHSLGVLAMILLACGRDDGPPTAPGPLSAPAAMVIVAGDNQPGVYGDFLAEPFTVRVMNAERGGVVGIQVTWAVSSGEGEFAILPGQPLARPVSYTDVDGVAAVYFRPTWPGPNSVIAIVGDGVEPATFRASGAPAVHINFAPMFDCTANDPSQFDEPAAPLAVGTVVVWEYMDWVHPDCAARIVSRSVPPGGTPFDSGILRPGNRSWLVLDAPGDWQYGDVINGGTATVRVR